MLAENHTKPINSKYGQNGKSWNIKVHGIQSDHQAFNICGLVYFSLAVLTLVNLVFK
jgi:hypothetical protein